MGGRSAYARGMTSGLAVRATSASQSRDGRITGEHNNIGLLERVLVVGRICSIDLGCTMAVQERRERLVEDRGIGQWRKRLPGALQELLANRRAHPRSRHANIVPPVPCAQGPRLPPHAIRDLKGLDRKTGDAHALDAHMKAPYSCT
jgi:hypothetical protein